jgi:hypothetical protein
MDDQRVNRTGSRLNTLRIILAVCFVVSGCEHRPPDFKIPMEGVDVGFGGGTGSCKIEGNKAHIEVGSSKYDIAIQDGKVTVNGRDLGTAVKGDTVIASEDNIFITSTPLFPRQKINPTH